MIRFEEMDVSSRQIRKAVALGQSIKDLVPGPVAGYIRNTWTLQRSLLKIKEEVQLCR